MSIEQAAFSQEERQREIDRFTDAPRPPYLTEYPGPDCTINDLIKFGEREKAAQLAASKAMQPTVVLSRVAETRTKKQKMVDMLLHRRSKRADRPSRLDATIADAEDNEEDELLQELLDDLERERDIDPYANPQPGPSGMTRAQLARIPPNRSGSQKFEKELEAEAEAVSKAPDKEGADTEPIADVFAFLHRATDTLPKNLPSNTATQRNVSATTFSTDSRQEVRKTLCQVGGKT